MKNILILSPHFPPSALPPSQRVRLLVKHLSGFGLYPIVLTTDSKYREELEDPWMNQLIGKEYREIKIKALPPGLTRKFGFGDLGLRMLPFLITRIRKIVKQHNVRFILYPVPPWYTLAIVPLIKRITKIPYGIDFIDPWVENELPKNTSFKQKISQKLARYFEKKAVKHANVIYAVSDGINKNLIKLHGKLGAKLFAIPYGVEPDDFKLPVKNGNNAKLTIRYIGAVWPDSYPVLEGLFRAFHMLKENYNFVIEFIGTSYAGAGLSEKQLTPWIEKHNLSSVCMEQPERVPYKKAIELNLTSDILLLFGGMQPYYAASKLMGLIASGKPFFAFLHKESFPAHFLNKLDYPYVITYSNIQKELPIAKVDDVVNTFSTLLNEPKAFFPLDINHPLIQENTANGMTKRFAEPIKNLLYNE